MLAYLFFGCYRKVGVKGRLRGYEAKPKRCLTNAQSLVR